MNLLEIIQRITFEWIRNDQWIRFDIMFFRLFRCFTHDYSFLKKKEEKEKRKVILHCDPIRWPFSSLYSFFSSTVHIYISSRGTLPIYDILIFIRFNEWRILFHITNRTCTQTQTHIYIASVDKLLPFSILLKFVLRCRCTTREKNTEKKHVRSINWFH